MTGYTVHVGTSDEYADGWDRIFGGDKQDKQPEKKSKKSAKKAEPKAKKKSAPKKKKAAKNK